MSQRVQTRIREKASTENYVHCASHCLNLVLNTSSQLPAVRNMFATMSDVINFFNESPKRRAMLEVNLLTFCDTRFIHGHDSILRLSEHFSVVLSCLQDIDEAVNMDAKTKDKSVSLLSSVSSSSFLVSLSAAKKVMSLTYTLSKYLQSPKLDMFEGTEMACSIIEHLQIWRVDYSIWHGGDFSVFSGCEQLAQAAGIELMKPGLTDRQQHRVSQVNADETASDYYKRSIWFPYLVGVISHMCDKFRGAATTAILLSSVLRSAAPGAPPIELLAGAFTLASTASTIGSSSGDPS